MHISAAEVLAVKIDKTETTSESIIRLFSMNNSLSKIPCLKSERIKISEYKWNIDDNFRKKLLRWAIAAQPKVPTIAFVKPDNHVQEIMARNLGIGLVLTNDIDNKCFCKILCQLLSAQIILNIEGTNNHVVDLENIKYRNSLYFSSSLPGFGLVNAMLSDAQHKNNTALL